MESVGYDYEIFNLDGYNASVSLNMTEFKISKDQSQKFYDGSEDRIDFETDYGRYEVNTTGYFIRERRGESYSYRVRVYAICRVSNPIEFSITFDTPNGIKQFEEAFKKYIDKFPFFSETEQVN
jgi:hypothetical protein